VRTGNYILFHVKRKRKSSVGNRMFITTQNRIAVKRVEFVSDRM
jgi:hypothetical protein